MAEIFEFDHLKVDLLYHGDLELKFVFDGTVDESFDYKLLSQYKAKRVLFDLTKLSNFNSCGLREWIYFIREYQDVDVIYQNCSIAVVDQLNMLPDLSKGVYIESFFAPYYCEEHGEISVWINMLEVEKQTLEEYQAPEEKCPKCDRTLEFDALEESYFVFLQPKVHHSDFNQAS